MDDDWLLFTRLQPIVVVGNSIEESGHVTRSRVYCTPSSGHFLRARPSRDPGFLGAPPHAATAPLAYVLFLVSSSILPLSTSRDASFD